MQKHDYLYFDLNTRQDTRAKFVDEKKIDGLTVYHFVTEVPRPTWPTWKRRRARPPWAPWCRCPPAGGDHRPGVKPGETLTMHRYAKGDTARGGGAKTGTIVDGREDQSQYFRFPDRSDETPRRSATSS